MKDVFSLYGNTKPSDFRMGPLPVNVHFNVSCNEKV